MNIYLVIDESGSMSSLKNDTIGGFNNFLSEQQALTKSAASGTVKAEPAMLHVVCFGTQHDKNIRKPIWGVLDTDVQPWTDRDYSPGGGTPLLDAVGDVLAGIKADETPGIIVIITDGAENASSEHTLEKVKAAIEEKQAAGWKVVFLGANIDAFSAGAGIGVRGSTTSGYQHNAVGTQAAYASASGMSSMTRSGIGATITADAAGNPQATVDPVDTTSKP